MDAPQPQAANTEANIRKAAEAIAEVLQMKQEFIRCHEFLANRSIRLVELLGQAESRGYLLEDSLTLVDTVHWLQMIDCQTKFLSMVLNFTKDPSTKSLRPLIELYGRDRDRMRVEAEILERQLKHRLATFGQPDDAMVRKVVMKNEQRVLAVYEFDPGHADGIRHVALDAGVRVLNEMIFECQRSLEGIEHARLDLDARGGARDGIEGVT